MQKTLVTFLLDRTGSMQAIKKDTIGGFNAYLEGLQQGDAADDTEFSLVQFDSSSIDKVHLNKPVKEVPKLDDSTYQPRDMTPLIDAAYTTIKAVETAVTGSDKKVVISIQTDGQENASTQHTWDELNALIKEKRALGWQFNFMGVGIDAYNQGAKMGIAAAATMSTTFDPGQMKAAYRSMGMNTALYASGATQNTLYTAQQKSAAGDAYDPALHPGPITIQKKPPAPSVRKYQSKEKVKIVDDLDLTK